MKINFLRRFPIILNKLFVSKGVPFEKESALLRSIPFNFPEASLVFGLMSVGVMWYEGLLLKFIPNTITDILPLIFIILAILVADKKKIYFYKAHSWYLVFLTLAIFSGFSAISRGEATLNVPFYVLIILYFFLALIWAQTQTSRKLLISFLWLALPAALYGIFEYYTGNFVFTTSALEETAGRASSFLQNPNVFGFVMTIVFLISVYFLQHDSKRRFAPFVFIFGLSIVLTMSRTAWLAALLGIIPLIKFTLPEKNFLSVGLLGGIKTRFEVLFSPEYWLNSSIDGRLWALNNGLYIAKKFPILGTGPGTYGGKFAETYSSPVYFYGMQHGYVALMTTDNQYIAFLVQLGVAGLMVFTGFLISLWLQSYKTGNAYAALSRAVLLSFAVMMLSANAFEFMSVSIPVAALAGISLIKEKQVVI